jgi:hypothetical protein
MQPHEVEGVGDNDVESAADDAYAAYQAMSRDNDVESAADDAYAAYQAMWEMIVEEEMQAADELAEGAELAAEPTGPAVESQAAEPAVKPVAAAATAPRNYDYKRPSFGPPRFLAKMPTVKPTVTKRKDGSPRSMPPIPYPNSPPIFHFPVFLF